MASKQVSSNTFLIVEEGLKGVQLASIGVPFLVFPCCECHPSTDMTREMTELHHDDITQSNAIGFITCYLKDTSTSNFHELS